MNFLNHRNLREMKTRRKIFAVIVSLLLFFTLVFLSGPRVEIDTTLSPPDLPNDLDRYLTDAEAHFDDIVPGTEKTIFWAGERGKQTDFSLVYFHGFSATRQEIVPLPELVASELKANIYYPRFRGHGRGSEAMLDGSVNAWLNDANEALEIEKRLGKSVILIGVSTGGTIATWLATQQKSEELTAIILMSPNFGPADPMSAILTWPWGAQFAETFIGETYSWRAHNPQQEHYWTTTYPTKALLPMMGLVKLAKSLDLARLKTPVLILYSPQDQVVDPAATEAAFARFGSVRKQLVPYTEAKTPDQHVLAGDILSPSTTEPLAEMIVDFVHHLGGKTS